MSFFENLGRTKNVLPERFPFLISLFKTDHTFDNIRTFSVLLIFSVHDERRQKLQINMF